MLARVMPLCSILLFQRTSADEGCALAGCGVACRAGARRRALRAGANTGAGRALAGPVGAKRVGIARCSSGVRGHRSPREYDGDQVLPVAS